jgi:hypothetical protein
MELRQWVRGLLEKGSLKHVEKREASAIRVLGRIGPP